MRGFHFFAVRSPHIISIDVRSVELPRSSQSHIFSAATATRVTRLQQELDETEYEEHKKLLYDANHTVWVRPRRNSTRHCRDGTMAARQGQYRQFRIPSLFHVFKGVVSEDRARARSSACWPPCSGWSGHWARRSHCASTNAMFARSSCRCQCGSRPTPLPAIVTPHHTAPGHLFVSSPTVIQ